MGSGRLRKYVVLTAIMVALTTLLIVCMACGLIPNRYDIALYLLIISSLLFGLYGLLGIAEAMQNRKCEADKEDDSEENVAEE